MRRLLPGLVIAAILVSGCATRGSVRQVQLDLAAMRAQMSALRDAHDDHARESARALADLTATTAGLRDIGGVLNETAAAVGRLTTRLTVLEEGIKDVRTDLAARPTPVAPPAPVEPPGRAREPGVAQTDLGLAQAAYETALASFRARDHGQAVLEFLDFLAKYPNHPLAPNAQYWIGEAYYMQRDYRQAVVEFEKVLDHPSPNGKAAGALLKIGLCYANLREPAQAQQTWHRLLTEHPESDAASQARGLIRTRRTSGRP